MTRFMIVKYKLFYPISAILQLGIIALIMLVLPIAGYTIMIFNSPMLILTLLIILIITKFFVMGIKQSWPARSTMALATITQIEYQILLIESILAWLMIGLIGFTINTLTIWSFSIEWLLLLGIIIISDFISAYIAMMYVNAYDYGQTHHKLG